jgi:thiol-disulfide isomerase/thioredoxin
MLGLRAMVQGASWSGKERNHLFMSLSGEQFEDSSGLSGLDHIADGRVFATLDMDRDGFQDMAVLNTNAPRFLLYRNTLGDAAERVDEAGGFLALRLEGGNRSPQTSGEWSARDGYGALVTVLVSDSGSDTGSPVQLKRELRCGEGLSAQNSATMIIGLGASRLDSVEVRWPSGRMQRIDDVPPGCLLTVYENPDHSPTGEAGHVAPYERLGMPSPGQQAELAPLRLDTPTSSDAPPLTLYTTTATWCAACKSRLPQLERLRARFATDELAMYGVPYDEQETAEQFDAYRARYAPAYELLRDLSSGEREAVKQLVDGSLGGDALPASIVTDAAGRVLLTTWGVPSVSKLRELRELVSD